MYKGDKWWVSPYNFEEEVMRGFKIPSRVQIHDVTLRDGEQMAGVIFSPEDKVAIAERLDHVGVDRIEAGNPVISESERQGVRRVARLGLSAKVFSLSRCVKSDIDMALDCDVSGIVLYSPGSELQLERKLGWSVERAVEAPVEAALYAKSHGLYVAYTAYDTTRGSLGLIRRILRAVVEEGKVDSVAIFDTVGCITPQAMFYLASRIKESVSIPLEVHCHNDLGMAVANTLAAVTAGVEIVHTAFNGLGERCGNAATEEVAIALKLLYNVCTGIKTDRIYDVSKFIEERSGIKLPVNKPLVGENAFRFEAGLVVDGILKYPLTMEPILPELVGRSHAILLGKKSGRSSIIYKLREMGIEANEAQIGTILQRVKELGEAKRAALTEEEFREIVKQVIG